MKFIKIVLSLILICLLWTISVEIRQYRLDELVAQGKIPYGPIPDSNNDYYSFNGLHAAFNSKIDLKRTEEFSKYEFEDLILKTLDNTERENFKKYLAPTLSLSEEYQIDPFWIISIMMVESSFNNKAMSHKNAHGLMQIRPDTAEHLYQLMSKKLSEEEISKKLYLPADNIEVGAFYLKKLLQNFRLNYSLATIAYNIGPNKLKELIILDEIDTVNFSYLQKVQDCYNDLTKYFALELKRRPKPFESTYVVIGQGKKLENKLLELFTTSSSDIFGVFLLSSENLPSGTSQSFIF